VSTTRKPTKPTRKRRGGDRQTQRQLLLLLGILALFIAGGFAFAMTGPSADDARADVELEGEPLEPLPPDDEGAVADPSTGEPAPVARGTTLDGEPITIGEPEDGRPQLVVGLAHWCPACQAEVPQVADAMEAGDLPDVDVDLLAFHSLPDPGRDAATFPPGEWLAEEGWTIPTLADDAGDPTMNALSGNNPVTPYWVAIDGEGRIVERRTGIQPIPELAAWMESLAEGS